MKMIAWHKENTKNQKEKSQKKMTCHDKSVEIQRLNLKKILKKKMTFSHKSSDKSVEQRLNLRRS